MLQLKGSIIAALFFIGGMCSASIISAAVSENTLSQSVNTKNENDTSLKKIDIAWLTLSESVLESYEFHIPSESSALMMVSPLWLKQSTELEKKILAIVPKKSSSYIQAANELLEMLKRNGIYAKVDIFNFGKVPDLGKAILIKAETENYDLIFSMGSESAGFLHKHYSGGRLPVVMSTCKDPVPLGLMTDYDQGSGNNIAWTSLNVPLAIQKSYLFQLKPNLKNVGLMFNQGHKQVMATEVIPAKREMKKWGLTVFDVAVEGKKSSKSIATPKETLARVIPQVISKMRKTDPELENSIFWITSSTAIFSEIELINQLSENIPVLAAIPNVVKQGDASAVLAIGIDRRNNAHLASIYAIKILKGEADPGDLKVGVVTPPDVAVNFRVAKKIGLKVPFSFFENAAFIYDYEGKLVRNFGQRVTF